MSKCPYCHSKQDQVKAGYNPSGSQRYLCNLCARTYTPLPNRRGYPVDMRYLAIKLYQNGNSFRSIARELGVGTQSVINWVRSNDDKRLVQEHINRSQGKQKNG